MQNEITELRNQVRTLKRIVYGFGCLLVAGVVIGATSLQTVPNVLKAKSIEVIDNNGKTVVYLGSLIEGTEQIASPFGEGSGLTRNKYLGIISTRNGEGKDLVRLTATTAGQGMVVTENGKGQTLVEMTSTVGGEGGLRTFNGKGQGLVNLGATVDGEGGLRTFNGKGQELVRLGVDKDGGLLSVYNNDEIKVASIGAISSGGFLGIVNNDQKPAVGISASSIGGILMTFDNKGEATFSSLN